MMTPLTSLIFPEPPKSVRCQSHISLSAEQRTVPQIALNLTAVVTIVGELIARRMAQHVTVNQEPELGRLSSPRDHPLISGHAEWCATLAEEQVNAFR